MTPNATLFNVYAVINGAPFQKVNKRRMRRDLAIKKVEKLRSEGSPRAYAIPDRGTNN